jgi:Heat induced stress protein YflT
MATEAGLFPDRGSAENAIRALQDGGFNAERIGIVMRDQRERSVAADEAVVSTATGAVTGGVVGGTLGAILAATGALVIPGIGPFISGGILATALVGGVAGWLVGGLVALGIPREEAEYYQGQVEQGRVLVTVDAMGREEEARTILLRNGAANLRETSAAAAGNLAPESLPPDISYETSATNPRGYPTEPVSNEPDNAGQPSVAPGESDASRERVILPPEFVANPRAAQNYGDPNTPREPLQGANSGVAGANTPSPDDAVPTPGQATPREDESAINPNGTQDASPGEAGITRDEDIIRQEQQRME